MSKSLFIVPLLLLLLSSALPVAADQYDDCITGCQQFVAPCVEKARLNAGNIQEEEDSIAACEKTREGCIKVCNEAEVQSQTPPQVNPDEQPQAR